MVWSICRAQHSCVRWQTCGHGIIEMPIRCRASTPATPGKIPGLQSPFLHAPAPTLRLRPLTEVGGPLAGEWRILRWSLRVFGTAIAHRSVCRVGESSTCLSWSVYYNADAHPSDAKPSVCVIWPEPSRGNAALKRLKRSQFQGLRGGTRDSKGARCPAVPRKRPIGPQRPTWVSFTRTSVTGNEEVWRDKTY